jgi:hypothetical protein
MDTMDFIGTFIAISFVVWLIGSLIWTLIDAKIYTIAGRILRERD